MMLVVHVGHVPVRMLEPAVLVRMGMRFAERIVRAVVVLVMYVMHMRVRVREHLVLVFMLVILGEMQPHPDSHEPASDKKNGRSPGRPGRRLPPLRPKRGVWRNKRRCVRC